jgi:multiple sugar transport system substrate-binding protein
VSKRERSPGEEVLAARISRAQFLKKMGLGAAALSSAQLLASCGFGGTGGGTGGGSEADEISGSFDWKREEGATINLLLNKHPYTDALLADLKSFKEKTGINVQHDIFPEENYFDKVTLDLSSGQANYDAFMLGAYMVWQYGPPGWLEDLKPWIENKSATNGDYDWEDVLPNLRDADSWSFKVGDPLGTGGQWALPWGFETNAIAYRSDVFDKLGLKPAETLDELVELTATLNDKAEGMYGMAVRGTRSWATIHPGFMTQYSRTGEKDYKVEGNSLTPAMNTPASVDFHDKWMRMVKDSGPPNWTQYTWYQVGSDLGAQKAAMIFDADINAYFQNQPGSTPAAGKIAWHPGPKGPDGSLATNLWVWSLGMNAKSKNKSAAWLFLQWATGKEHLRKAALEANHVDPVRRSIADDPAFKDVMARNKDYIDTFNQLIDSTGIQFTPQPKFFDTTTSWAATLQEIYRGEDAKGALDTLASDLKSKVA